MTDYVLLEKGHRFTFEEEQYRIRRARRVIAHLEGVGRALGYGIFHGGSLIRDIDVVAVPWQAPTADEGPEHFVFEVCRSMSMHMGSEKNTIRPTLYGHVVATLWTEDHPDHPLDLKVMRPGATPVSKAESLAERK